MATQGRKPGPKSNVTAQMRSGVSPMPSIMNVVKAAYSPDRLYTESTDVKGHYETISVKITPAMHVLAHQAVDDNLDYHGSVQAVLRDALFHRLYYLHHNPGSTIDPASLAREMRRTEMQAILAKTKAVGEDCEMLMDVADDCIETDNYGELNSLIERIQNDLDTIPFALGHRNQIEEALNYAIKAMAGIAPRRRK